MKLPAIFLIAAFSLFAAGEYSNRRAPGFSLSDSHFQQHDTQDYRGKVLIIEFMQTTCPVCQRLADTLLQVKAKYGDRIGVMSILTLPDNFQTVEKFATDRKIPWPMVFDSGQVMISYLKVTPVNPKVEFPHVFLIDGKGTIRNDFGPAEEAALNVAGLSAEIDKLLK
ncbi:MAG: TlpA disulfide reductase family protein [Bryobacteraceae bacterium]|jgi:peroxiredoxin